MRKILPIILILLGISEIIMVFLDIKTPIIIAMVLGVLLIALGVKTLLDIAEKKVTKSLVMQHQEAVLRWITAHSVISVIGKVYRRLSARMANGRYMDRACPLSKFRVE